MGGELCDLLGGGVEDGDGSDAGFDGVSPGDIGGEVEQDGGV